MAYHSEADDIEDEISSWGYSATLSNYHNSLSESRIPTSKIGGRGRGITNPHHMANVRLASGINDLNAHSFPMGHLATTKELLDSPAENEITPILRQLGLSSRDDDVSSKTTRRNPELEEEIRLDGNIPVILDATLFRADVVYEDEEIVEADRFNPELPLHEQFSTIPELVVDEEEIKCNKRHPSKQTKSNDLNNSTDSALASSTSSSSIQSNKSKGKGKKKKWRKMTAEEMVPQNSERGRYEECYSIGVHDSALNSIYAPRQIYGADGLKGWPAQ
ncbi:uncharacterized protein LOC131681631 isoform X2 [Topomyia yanbarensis]|uniref:uncharacterized protein LOC131681631 isoform X2 n=1 Tax=Topomyia yanbarensis TaxID=2498891 RepID=UPI00273BECDA|nr:uncharacterized protein LOC131681631 isoform X2 [Topomyia yanbarensis]